jgi:hypothetical protein
MSPMGHILMMEAIYSLKCQFLLQAHGVIWRHSTCGLIGETEHLQTGRVTELIESTVSPLHITKCNSSVSEQLYQSICGPNYCITKLY